MSFSRDTDGDLRESLAGVGAFLKRALRFWFAVPVALAVAGLACLAFLRLRNPEFRSETVVLYSQGSAPGETPDQAGGPRNVTVRMKELLMSRPKLEKVVTEYDLYREDRQRLGMAEAVDELRRHIDYRAPGGDTFSIAFVGSTPAEAQRVTARLARLVIEKDAELRKQQAVVARDFLVAEKTKTEARLRSAERELAAFMAKHPRFALDTTPLAQGAAIRATTASSAFGTPLGPAVRTIPTAASPPAAGAPPSSRAPVPSGSFDADSEVSRATAAVAAARAHLGEELEHYTPAHPDVRAAQAAVERAESRLALLGQGAGATPVPPAASADPAMAAVEPSKAQKPIARPPPRTPVPSNLAAPSRDREVVALETDWLKLTSAVTEARQRQDQVEGALFKADILASSESSGRGLSMTVIDPAYLPAQPLPPGRALIVLMFAAVGLLLGLGVVLLLALFDDRILGARDVGFAAEVLALVPGRARRVHVPS
jgi:capsular polysaccharide biosynthesis protein